VLAAGTSSRLGRPKQTLPLGGRAVLQHVLDAAASAELDEVVVVLGHAAEDVESAIELPPGARTLLNPDYRNGQSSSLRAGLAALAPEVGAAVVLLGDQPGVRAEAIRRVVDTYLRTAARIVQGAYGRRRGHPVLLDRRVWEEAVAASGDVGARELLHHRPEWVTAVDLGGEPPPDIDTWEDFERLTALDRSPKGPG